MKRYFVRLVVEVLAVLLLLGGCADELVSCTNCGTQIDVRDKYCGSCGEEIGKAVNETEQALEGTEAETTPVPEYESDTENLEYLDALYMYSGAYKTYDGEIIILNSNGTAKVFTVSEHYGSHDIQYYIEDGEWKAPLGEERDVAIFHQGYNDPSFILQNFLEENPEGEYDVAYTQLSSHHDLGLLNGRWYAYDKESFSVGNESGAVSLWSITFYRDGSYETSHNEIYGYYSMIHDGKSLELSLGNSQYSFSMDYEFLGCGLMYVNTSKGSYLLVKSSD